MKTTFYELLGVDPAAPVEVIDAAWKALARKFHPDRSKHPGAAEMMKRINEAHDTLADPKRRRAYDLTIKNGNGHRPDAGRGSDGFPNVQDWMRGAANAYPNAYPFTDETVQQEIQAAGVRITQLVFDRMVENLPSEFQRILWNALNNRGGGR